MKNKRFLIPLFLIMIIGLLNGPLAAGASAGTAKGSECPTVLQRGEVLINIPAGETVGTATVQFIPCVGMNVQTSGGSMLEMPIIINAISHQDYLILRAHLLEPQEGPIDVTVWWRVD